MVPAERRHGTLCVMGPFRRKNLQTFSVDNPARSPRRLASCRPATFIRGYFMGRCCTCYPFYKSPPNHATVQQRPNKALTRQETLPPLSHLFEKDSKRYNAFEVWSTYFITQHKSRVRHNLSLVTRQSQPFLSLYKLDSIINPNQ